MAPHGERSSQALDGDAGHPIEQAPGPLLVDQLSAPHGATAVDVHARMSFGVRQNGLPETNVETLVRNSIDLFDEKGVAVPITVTREEGKLDPRYDMLLLVQPVNGLAADRWHELRTTMSEAITVRLQDPVDVSAGSASVRFFTGSAPMIRKLTRYEAPGKPALLVVAFSEPVSLASFPGTLKLVVDEKPVQPCIVAEEGNGVGCLKEGSSIHTEAFQILLSPSTGPVDARSIHVAFPASLQGSGRTVAEGLVVAGATGAQVSSEGVAVDAAQGAWYPCQPDATCWMSPRP